MKAGKAESRPCGLARGSGGVKPPGPHPLGAPGQERSISSRFSLQPPSPTSGVSVWPTGMASTFPCYGVRVVWDPGHPYRWRTWLRGRLPWTLINLGLAAKGADCERVGGAHHWYNADDRNSGCYHCTVVRPGQLWKRLGGPVDP